jgi:hypothetical protein
MAFQLPAVLSLLDRLNSVRGQERNGLQCRSGQQPFEHTGRLSPTGLTPVPAHNDLADLAAWS